MSMKVLGAKRKHLSGYSAATQGLHEGFIFGSEIIQVRHPCFAPLGTAARFGR